MALSIVLQIEVTISTLTLGVLSLFQSAQFDWNNETVDFIDYRHFDMVSWPCEASMENFVLLAASARKIVLPLTLCFSSLLIIHLVA